MTQSLLRKLVCERHWQRHQTFVGRFEAASRELAVQEDDPTLGLLTVSSRQFERWMAGDVSRPRPNQCRVLELMFGVPVDQLFAPADSPVSPIVEPGSTDGLPAELVVSTVRAHDFLRETQLGYGEDESGVDQLMATALRLASEYPTSDVRRMVAPLNVSYNAALTYMSKDRSKAENRDVNLAGGILAGLLSKASQDLQAYDAAFMHARVAAVCAERAGHAELRGWVLAIKSLIKYWSNDPFACIEYAQKGSEAAEASSGSVSIWLPALEARAHALVGNASAVRDAAERAAEMRQRLATSELDSIGGLMSFPIAKELYYLSEAVVLLGDDAGKSLDLTTQALEAYESAPAREHDNTSKAGARCNVAFAYARIGDIGSAMDTIRPVFESGNSINTHGVRTSVARVENFLSSVRSPEASRARNELAAARATINEPPSR